MTRVHISEANGRDLGYGDIVTQGGVPYRVAAVTGFTNGFGFQPEAVWLVPTHNADGDPMPDGSDVYRSTVHTPSGSLNQARWFGPQSTATAYLVNR